MATLPSISVVVPVRNAARTIEECIESLLALRYPSDLLELIAVDNGSTDRTPALLERYGAALTVLDQSTRGPAAARNAGIARATGEVVAFTDADCTVDVDWLAELVPPLADARVGISGGSILARQPANAVQLYGERIHDHRRAIECLRPPYAITMSWASRRSVLEEVGLFDESFRRCEDSELSYRIVAAGYTIAFRPSAIAYHRNERSLAGLFREGWQHGFHAVPVLRRHARLIADAAAEEQETSDATPRGTPELVFGAGKRVGRLMGEARFR